MAFERLEVRGWQQFEAVDIVFHPHLTVVTGANGAGKTTLLRFVARHLGWGFHYLATPYPVAEQGFRYAISLLFKQNLSADPHTLEIGAVTLDTGQRSSLRVPTQDSQAPYTMGGEQSRASGFFIPSHRREFTYQRVENLPLKKRNWSKEAFSTVQDAIRNASSYQSTQGTVYRMKEILIALGIFGYGSAVVQPDHEARHLYESFQRILEQVLPVELGFIRLEIRDQAEVVMITSSGDFLIDGVSGGVAALIEISWQIFMYDPEGRSIFTVVIDEPENHLHASMQRALMPNLIRAFPNTQFIVATHSPLIIGSVKDSHVYALRYSKERKVYSEMLDLMDKSGTAEDVLREVLGVETTIPIWAENTLGEVIRSYLGKEMTPPLARAIKTDLQAAGLDRWIPEALIRIAEEGVNQ